MSTFESSNVREKLNNLTECPVCAGTYNDPRVLPCVHTYCLKCIKGFSEYRHPGDRVSCPLCRKDFIVPENGIDSLPKNFFIEQLKDLKLESGDDGKVPEAVGKMSTLNCDKHLDKALQIYCFQCNEVVCLSCLKKSHESHKWSEIDDVCDDFKTQMTGDIQNMSKTAKYCRDVVKEQEKKRDDFNDVVKKIENEICDTAERMKQMIDSEKLKLLQELSRYKTDRMKQIQHVIENVKQHAQFADSLAAYMEELKLNGKPCAVAQQARALRERADGLMKFDQMQSEVIDLGSVQVSFDAAKIPPETTGKLIGTIKWKQMTGNPEDFS
jgi:tripartite motif-containing protein 2/3